MALDDDPRPDGEVVRAEDATGPLLRFTGSIDRDAVRRFRLLVPPASWPARVDLGAVTELGPAGLELLVHLSRKPRRHGGELVLTAVPDHLRPVLAQAGLSRLVPRTNGTPSTA
jgi:anti-anti-sigma factor